MTATNVDSHCCDHYCHGLWPLFLLAVIFVAIIDHRMAVIFVAIIVEFLD